MDRNNNKWLKHKNSSYENSKNHLVLLYTGMIESDLNVADFS